MSTVFAFMYIERKCDLAKVLQRKSCFLFGPRQTGKSSLIRHTLKTAPVYNLLDSDVFLKLARWPSRLKEELNPKERIVIIDEIQKLPSLLDMVHILIEEQGIHFLLTGSSARKLRRGGGNLLGGRALVKHLNPFSYSELGQEFDLARALNHGLLPSTYLSDMPDEDLEAYVGAYLKEEVASEGLTRNIPAFSRFLEVAALCNSRIINYAKMANDAQVARSTVQEYFEILKDTLLADELTVWKKSKKRKAISTSKMYLFDTGIVRTLQNRAHVRKGSPEFGEMLETYIFHELKTYCDYTGVSELNYWRCQSGFEVDFIIAGKTAIEVKASKSIRADDLKGLKALMEEKGLKTYLLVSLESVSRKVDGIEILPWDTFLTNLWEGAYV
jgi:predicted AAA+ superfamily ATPase